MSGRAGVRLLLAGLGVVTGALCAELGLRLAAALNPGVRRYLQGADPEAILIEPTGTLGFRQKPFSTFVYGNGTRATTNAMGFRGPVVSAAKPAGLLRIELFGGSSTFGWGVDDSQTIDGYMRDLLSREYPGRRFEVVNLSFDAYDSYQDLNRFLSDGLSLGPDIVIVNSGLNDVAAARFPNLQEHDPRTLIWEADLRRLRDERARGDPTPWTSLKHYSYLARLGGMLRHVWTHRAHRQERATEVPNFQAAEYFERNLRRFANMAASHGAAIILSTPPSALGLRFAPHDTSSRAYWVRDATTTQQVRDTMAARMLALADSLRAEGTRVAYVCHTLPADVFLDDAHLASAGNLELARDFVADVTGLLDRRPAQGVR
jgi:lysophospholipase L1-like esterase